MHTLSCTILLPSTLGETSIAAVASLLFFFTLFLGILAWLVIANKSGRFARDARIPLEDEPVEERGARRPLGKEQTHG
jgi:cbb3-type cytochrome oxidase subunit 3